MDIDDHFYRYRTWDRGSSIAHAGPLVRACLTEYALNLLGRHALTSEFMRFLVCLLPGRLRTRLARVSLEPEAAKMASRQAIHAGCLADMLVNGLGGRTMRLHRKELEENIFKAVGTNHRPGSAERTIKRNRRLAQLRDLLQLDPDEIQVVCLLYCCKQNQTFSTFCSSHGVAGFVRTAAVATGISVTRMKKIISPDGALAGSGVLEERYANCGPPEIDDEVVDYLSGLGDLSLTDRYCRQDRQPALELDSFNVAPNSLEIVRSLMDGRSPASILLYGAPGTGKTEFARAVAAAAGVRAFFVHCNERRQRGKETGDRRLPLRASLSMVTDRNGILVVDEADSFLNTGQRHLYGSKTPDKAWVNDFLDRSRARIIWITNSTCGIEESTMRRFAYSLPFERLTRREREAIWLRLIRKKRMLRLVPEEWIRALSSEYKVNAGGIASAVTSLREVTDRRKLSAERRLATLRELLKQHQQAIGCRETGIRNAVVRQYDVDAVNADVDTGVLVSAVRRFVGEAREGTPGSTENLNLLFWGPPGAGKTEFVKHIAAETSMDLLVKRASDLVSCWVGETEKNIRASFEEAARERAILFIDEADSFFIDRKTALRSWETSQTNELLTQMENHGGILICCTNLLHSLDRAAMRRFAWKIQFMPLTREGRLGMYYRYFDLPAPLDADAELRLAGISGLVPGDIRAVWQKFRFSTPAEMTHDMVISWLEDEVRYREGSRENVGFASQ